MAHVWHLLAQEFGMQGERSVGSWHPKEDVPADLPPNRADLPHAFGLFSDHRPNAEIFCWHYSSPI
jgi:hypothetical protein